MRTDFKSATTDKTDCKIGLDGGLWATININGQALHNTVLKNGFYNFNRFTAIRCRESVRIIGDGQFR
jgi:hypothetical protein